MDAVTPFESSFAISDAGARRLDVIPAGPARRRWSAEAKARIVAESLAPGTNVSEVARRHQLFPQQLYAWRRQLGERIEAGEAATFVPAIVAQARSPASAGAEIRIAIDGMELFVPEGASADHIERVLLAVKVAS